MSQRQANGGRGAKPRENKSDSIFKNLSRAKVEEIQIEDLSPKDIIIAVMGPTGTGKSSFIEKATGVDGRVGHTLRSFTSEISVVKLSFPGIIDSDICLVDTPGFDHTRTPDTDVLKMIADWLNDTYNRQIQLTGLLYFHRITDNRMTGTPLKNLRVFQNLCGEDFKSVLVTTNWDNVVKAVGESREAELKWTCWKPLIDGGSSVRRFDFTQRSAFDILAPIIDKVNKRSTLLLQKEMNDLGLKLKQTTAGRTLYSELGELVARHQKIAQMIRSEMMNPALDPERLETLMNDYKIIYTQLQRTNKDLKKMKISVGEQIERLFKSIDWNRIFGISLFNLERSSAKEEFQDSEVTEESLDDHPLEDREEAELEATNEDERHAQDNPRSKEKPRHEGHSGQWKEPCQHGQTEVSKSAIQGTRTLIIKNSNITMM